MVRWSTALHIASYYGHSEVVKELIAAGAKVDVQANDGSTALHIARENGRLKVVKELIAAGAKVDVQDN
ncbi:Eye-specific diacylglycerol kinase, partial [Diplonema papillatum]